MTEKKRIPFDLDRALAGDKVVTRDGREVSEIYHFKTVQDAQPVRAVVDGDIQDFCMNGCFLFKNDKRENHYDLFMAPKVKTYWVNIYKESTGMYSGVTIYLSEKEALDQICIYGSGAYVKTISFEVEE